MIIQYWLILTK